MKQRTAIIDIGSNSARVVIFEKTSLYGFHLLCEQKSKVRISEGAYANNSNLQPEATKRAFLAIQSFVNTTKKYQVNSIYCVATSAIRDAPNGHIFIKSVKENLGLDINIISGNTEARYGALAATNLLPIESAITIDIGGGSSDMAIVENGNVIETYSLDLGTVRLKELFSDKKSSLLDIDKKVLSFIHDELKTLPATFKHHLAIGIGGTARTLAKGIMKHTEYPLEKLHAYVYEVDKHMAYINHIISSDIDDLDRYYIKKNRFDTIKEGTTILREILLHIGATKVMTSSAGVREGVYLDMFLKDNNYKFPKGVNPSIVSILDRFDSKYRLDKKVTIIEAIYDIFAFKIEDNNIYKKELIYAFILSNIGRTLNIYKSHQHAYYIAMQELNYGFTHREMVLISIIIRMQEKELIYKPLFERYGSLLPKKETLKWLSFIYNTSIQLDRALDDEEIEFMYENKTLTITTESSLYIAKEKIANIKKPEEFDIIIKDIS